MEGKKFRAIVTGGSRGIGKAILIELAKRNGSLIIETITLLKIFEKFKKEEITVEEIKKLLVEEIGLLQI